MAFSCEPQDLISAARCYDGCIPSGMQRAVQNYLLCELVGIMEGGVPGQTCLLCGAGPPTNPAPCRCSIYYSTPPNSGVWVWDDAASQWDMVIAPGP